MNKQPLLILVCCFISGILFQDYFSFDRNFIFSTAVFCAFVFISRFFKSYLISKVSLLLLFAFFFGLGINLHYLNYPEAPKNLPNSNERIAFKVSQKLNSTDKNKKYEIFAKAGKETFKSVLLIPKESKELDFEHYYRVETFISQPKAPEYDFQFDYSKYLQRRNIFYQFYSNGEIASTVRADLSFGEIIRQERLEVLRRINHSKMSSKSQEFLKGIILADRTETDSEILQDFNRSGLMHFLAISGTHVVVIFGMLYFVLMKFLPLRFRKSVIILSLIFIWIFALFIGFGSSVLRSCIMLTVYFIYVLLQRKSDLLHSLALSAFVILIIDTNQLFDVGFQLSFLAVFGIYWLNQPILKYLPRHDNYLKKIIFNTISISLSAQLATLPLVLCYFHQFSFISIIANFFIVPFSEVIIIFSFLMTGLMAVGFDFWFITMVYDFIIKLLLNIIHWFADFECFFFENISMTVVEAVMLFAVIYFLRFIIVKHTFKNVSRWILSVLLFFIIRISLNIYENQKEEILVYHYKKGKVFSVKKGDSVCFWIENIHESKKIQQYIVNPYLSSRRIKNVAVKLLPSSSEKVVFNNRIYELK